LLTLKKNTQHATSQVYEYIPMVDLNEKWDDEKLFNKYKLNESEIEFINNLMG